MTCSGSLNKAACAVAHTSNSFVKLEWILPRYLTNSWMVFEMFKRGSNGERLSHTRSEYNAQPWRDRCAVAANTFTDRPARSALTNR
ncbi:hypothetical protein EVAR_63634_1 [Eumeta japonica]|uniref:Uncharacterized protein n=1 Tax=Eumeta variegata TaxID=151549 RepID=A0A4C1ZYA1_EUMVA|nr:hypothetical protein EVAR_63634_1 [Eumeta japonica]